MSSVMTLVNMRFCTLVAIALGIFLAGCGATPIEEVDPSLTGEWNGACEISLPVVFDPGQLPDDVERTRQKVALEFTIDADATVQGTVGEATVQESVLKRNRGELGRRLNMASDYIVIDGHLAGPIVPGADENDSKSFTLPFDLVDNRIEGGLMWRQAGKYPFPLCNVMLERHR